MRIVCQQMVLMKYHALFVIFEKSSRIWNCRLLQIEGRALWQQSECFTGKLIKISQNLLSSTVLIQVHVY